MKGLSSYCADIIIANFKLRLSTQESHIFYALHESLNVLKAKGTADYFIDLKSFDNSSGTQQYKLNFETKLDGEDAYIGYYSSLRRKAVFLFYESEIAVSLGNALRQFIFLLSKEMQFLILHSAAVLLKNDDAILLCGKSGNGKSTAVSLLRDMPIISDDLVIIELKKDKPFIWAMPGSKSSFIASNKGFPLVALLLLIKSEDEKIEVISPATALAASFNFYGLGKELDDIQAKMDLVYKVISKVSLFNLYFRKTTNLTELLQSYFSLK